MCVNVIHGMTYVTYFVKRRVFARVVESVRMAHAKDTRLTFRVRSDLKKELESVASSEGRSVAQICEAFLRSGLANYQKEGTKFVRRFLAREEPVP